MVDFKSALVKANVGKNFVSPLFLTAIFAFLGVALLSMPKTASAAMCIYANTDGLAVGNFNDAANWTNCNGNAPGVGDDVIITSGTSTQLTADVAISTINSSGTIDARQFGLNVTSTVRLDNGGVVTSTSGYLGFGGAVTVGTTGASKIGSISGNINVSSTFELAGSGTVLDIGSGTTTAYGDFLLMSNATFYGRSGTLDLQGASIDIGSANTNPGTGRTVLTGGAGQTFGFSSHVAVFRRIEINKLAGTTVTLVEPASTIEDLIILSGTLALGTETFNVGGDFLVNGGTFTPGTGTITLNGSGAQSVSSTGFATTTINNTGGSVTLTANTTSTGPFTILSGTFDMGTYTLSAGGNFTVGTGGVFTPGTGTINLNGSGSQTVSSTSLYNLTIAKSGGTADLALNTTTTNNFSLTNGGFSLGSRNFNVGGDFIVNSGTFNAGTAIVTLNGAGAQNVSSTGFYDLTIAKSGGTIATCIGNNLTAYNFLITSGELSLGTNVFDIGGDFIVNAGGTFTPGTGTVNFIGSGSPQSVSSTSFATTTISGASSVTLTANTTSTGPFTISSGTFNMGAYSLSAGGNFIVDAGGTFTPGTATTTLNGSGTQSVSSTAFYDLVVNNSGGTATLTSNASTTRLFSVFGGTFDAQSYDFTAASTTVINNGGVVTSTSGNLGFGGTLTIGSTGSNALGSSSGNINASSTFTMTGASTKFEVGSGTSTFYGDFDISSSATLNGNNGTLEFRGGDVVIDVPTVNLQNSKSIFSGGIAQNIVGGATNNVVFGDVEIAKSANYVLLNNAATTTGNLTIISGELCPGIYTLNVGGNFTVNGGTFTPGTATTTLNGPGAQSVSSTGFYDLVINKSGSTVTFADGGVTVSGTLMLSNGGLNLGNGTTAFTAAGTPFQLWGGTFYPANGTVAYQEDQTVASTTYYNLSITPSAAKIATLNASTTALGAVTVNANGTLTVGANNFTVLGTIANTGQITVSTGSIIHPAESVLITNSSGVEVSSLSNTGSVYVTVQDSNRNLNGASVESFTVPVSFNAAAGSDAETMTLTETSVSSGIFRNASAVALVSSSAKSLGNNQFELLASGIGTATYTDSQDATDSASDIVTLTYVAPTVTPSVSGGGGGGGGGPTPSQTGPVTISVGPKTTIDTASLQKMQTSGFVIHQLVKLPDDGDPATQEDSAVYYLGADGRRHAFPNDKAYKTWYCDFSGVTVMPSADLAAIPLGRNVIYKSGRKMVKFTTDPKVYAVEKGGVLRWVTTEQLAIDFYGANWNKQIDDINDAFYTNYIFGQDIETAADFSPSTAVTKVSYPSDSMGIEGYTESAQAVTVFVCPGTTTPVDSDQDGLNDEQEITLGTDPTNKDTDGDSLTDGDEVNVYFTNPLNKDTDGDGYDDGLEVFTGHDPSADTDGDGLTDAEEAKLGTDPLKKDTDGDGYDDGTEVATGHDPLKE